MLDFRAMTGDKSPVTVILAIILIIQIFSVIQFESIPTRSYWMLKSSLAQSAPAPVPLPPVVPPAGEPPISSVPQEPKADSGDPRKSKTDGTMEDTNYLDYASEDFGIKLKYPATATNVIEGDQNPDDGLMTLFQFNIPNSESLIYIWVIPESGYSSVKEAAESQISQASEAGRNVTVTNPSASVGGYPAYQTLTIATPKVWIGSTLALVGDSLYVVDYAGPPSSYNDHRPVAEDLIKTIEITGINSQ
jgi:hypothetical protein